LRGRSDICQARRNTNASRWGYARMIDLQEAAACLDEHRIALANICGMLKPVVAEGGLGEVLGKLNQELIEKLNAKEKDATILSIIILEGLKETREQLMDFPGELADFFVALNQLRLVIDKATEARAEYLRQAEAARTEKERGAGLSETIREFKRSIGLMSDEEAREEMNMLAKKAELASNTPDQLEICAAAETVAPGSEAGTEIRIESLENAGPSAEDPGEECGTRVDTKDDAETILNWLVDLDRTSLIAFLSDEAEVARLVVVRSGRQRTALAKHRENMDYLDRVNRILTFFRDGKITPGMSEHELSLCRSFEEKMPVRGPS
jgi:hypothetical protein